MPDRIPTLSIRVPSRENAASKGLRWLVEGRVRVRLVHRGRVHAEVRGDSGRVHNVRFAQNQWRCTCQAGGNRCSHLRAVWLVVAQTTD